MRVLRLARGHPNEFRARKRAGVMEPEVAQAHLAGALAYRTSDGFERALETLGHTPWAIVVNDSMVQRAWAAEHGLPRRSSLLEIASTQVREFQPDVVYVGDIGVVPPSWVTELRAQVDSIRAVVAWVGAAHDDLAYWHTSDLVLSCVPELLEAYRDRGPMALLRHGFDERILAELPERRPEPQVLAAFQLQRTPGRHERRVQVLEELVAGGLPLAIHAPQYHHEPVDELRFAARRLAWRVDRGVGGLGVAPVIRDRFVGFRKVRKWDQLPPPWRSRALQPFLRPPIWGRDLYARLRTSAVALNVHADVSTTYASNLRLYEATGIGTCLVTEDHANLHELFEPDHEVVTWRSTDELSEKLRWLLDHPADAEDIALAGQQRTLREHRLADRVAEWLELVEPLL